MSASPSRGHSGNEDQEEATRHPSAAGQIEAPEHNRLWLRRNSMVQRLLPRYFLNGINTPVIEGIDPSARGQDQDRDQDRDQDQEQQQLQERQQQEQQQDRHRPARGMTGSSLPHSERRQNPILSLPQALQQREDERRREQQSRRLLRERRVPPQTSDRSIDTHSPHSNPPQNQAAGGETVTHFVSYQPQTPAPTLSTSYTTFPSLADSPVRYQRLPRAHIMFDFLSPLTPEGFQQGPVSVPVHLQESGRLMVLGQQPQSSPLSGQAQAQAQPTPNPLLPSTPAGQQTLPQTGDIPVAALRAQIEAEDTRGESLIPAAENAINVASNAGVLGTPGRNAVTAAAAAEARTIRRAHRARRSPSPLPLEAIHSAHPDTDYRFRHLLSHFHSRATLPTPPSRPFHQLPGSDAQVGMMRVMGHERAGGQSRMEATRAAVATSMVAQPGAMLLGTYRTSVMQGSSTLGIANGSSGGRLSIAHTPRPSNPHIITLSPSPNAVSTRSPSPRTGPPPLSRALLERYALSAALNPQRLPWHSLAFVTHVYNTRRQNFARARARILARREQAREAQRRAIERARTARREQAMDAQRVQYAVTNLALCGSLSDSRRVLGALERAEEEQLQTDSRSAYRREREIERGWVPTAQIVTPTERYALRAALARRNYLGERMGFDRQLAWGLGEALGRWMYDIWVAQGAAATISGADRDGGNRGRGRVGAVWLGPPGGNGHEGGQEMDVDGDGDGDGNSYGNCGHGDMGDGVREWHIIPDDGESADGVGEGWVEWREPGQGRGDGRFVLHDVFRFADEGGVR